MTLSSSRLIATILADNDGDPSVPVAKGLQVHDNFLLFAESSRGDESSTLDSIRYMRLPSLDDPAPHQWHRLRLPLSKDETITRFKLDEEQRLLVVIVSSVIALITVAYN
jgi:hypothetical protein